MFRKPKKNKAALFRKKKKRDLDNDEDGSDDNNATEKNVAKNKKRFRRRSSSSDEEEGNSFGDTNNGDDDDDGEQNEESTTSLLQQIKNESKKKGRDSSSNKKSKSDTGFMHEYNARDKPMTQKDLATLQSEHHPTNLTNSRSEREKESSATTESAEKPARNKFLAGPIKASKFIRTTSRFDYQPDICKDFKETGFCGFGDSCIYLHDRTDMKTGFQLEQEWELRKKREQEKKEREMEIFCKVVGGGAYQADDGNVIEDDGIPFACYLCRGHFNDPIVTQCGHYFCQGCILKRVQEECDPTCPICQQDMCGVFNFPTKLENKKKKVVGRRGTWEEYLMKMNA